MLGKYALCFIQIRKTIFDKIEPSNMSMISIKLQFNISSKYAPTIVKQTTRLTGLNINNINMKTKIMKSFV